MPTKSPDKFQSFPQEFERALVVLKTFDNGSARPSLMPIDQAVTGSCSDRARAQAVEARLLEILAGGPPETARQYICAKLALVGSVASAKSLVKLLDNPKVSTDARTALESISDPEVGRWIIRVLPGLPDPARAGAMMTLGARRDSFAVKTLALALREPGVPRKAAAAALGRIGTARAAAELERFYVTSGMSVREEMVDPILTCAERLDVSAKAQANRLRALVEPLRGEARTS
jgi:hypothetical protein